MDAGLEFGRVAGAYARFRPAFPERTWEVVLAHAPRPHDLAIDLGAGTGLAAAALARAFDAVVAVEPDREMASELAQRVPGADVRVATAEEVEGIAPESAALVVAANSFAWMDGPRVLARARSWLRPGGSLALLRYGFPRIAGEADRILQRELAARWDAFRDERIRDEGRSLAQLEACEHFDPPEVHRFELPAPGTVDEIVGFLASTSYVSAWLRSLADPGAALERLSSELAATARDGRLALALPAELLLARRADRAAPRAGGGATIAGVVAADPIARRASTATSTLTIPAVQSEVSTFPLVRAMRVHLERAGVDDDALAGVLDRLLQHLDCQAGTVHVLDPASGQLVLRASRGIPDAIRDKVERIPVGKGMAGLAAERREPVQVCNLQTDASGVAKPGAKLTRMEGSITVPMLASHELRGTIGVAKRVPYEFDEHETTLLVEIAGLVAERLGAPA